MWDLPPEKGVKVHFIQDYELWGGEKSRVDATCRLPMPKITPAKWVKTLAGRSSSDKPTSPASPTPSTSRHSPPRRACEAAACRRSDSRIPLSHQRVATSRSKRSASPARTCPDLKVVMFRQQPRRRRRCRCRTGAEFHLRAPEAKLKELYGQCDAWLFGTRKEGFGLPILEAMACRTPVIGTPAGAVPELLEGGGGMLIPMEDPAAMADAIREIRAMPDTEWRRISDAAHATASRYTWDDATDLFEDALRRAVKTDSRSNTYE